MDPIVATLRGKLRGRLSDGVTVFKGVPYAAPPFGANRLRPPQPIEPWDSVRDALAFGPKSPQVSYPPGIAECLAELVGAGEDCLTLDISTPALAPATRPVMVWIPGGMFEFHATGASAFYDGSRFARDGVVCVTINYRVGAEGFLYLGDGIANLGLLDQIAALEWVQENIGAFGGDPRKITIFGESAGAMSVATLLSMPRAKGLFHRAIVESGTGHSVNSPATALRISQWLAENLGISPIPGGICRDFTPAPTVDGETILERPVDRILAGSAAGIDLLVGSNTEETRLFLLPNDSIDRITQDAVVALAAAYRLSPEALSMYHAAHPSTSAGDLFSIIQTDWYWRIPAIRLADAHATKACASTYMYEFAWRSPQLGGRLGAAHGVEIPFVFDTLGLGTEPLLGRDPPQQLAEVMHAAWVAFAADGDCRWPKYDLVRRRTMRFDTKSQVVDDPLAVELALWKGVR